jgi:hypothetical protein
MSVALPKTDVTCPHYGLPKVPPTFSGFGANQKKNRPRTQGNPFDCLL